MVARTLAFIIGLVANAHIASALAPSVDRQSSLVTTTLNTGGDACPTEQAACIADSSCSTCMNAFNTDLSGCSPPANLATCDDVNHFFCCAVSDCISNNLFTDYVGCAIKAEECHTFDAIACVVGVTVLTENDDGDSDDDDDGDDDDDDDDDDDGSDDYSWDEEGYEDSIGDSSDSDSDSDSATPSSSSAPPVATMAALLLASTAAARLARL